MHTAYVFRMYVFLKSLPASLLCHSNFHGKNCYPSICELLDFLGIHHKHIRVFEKRGENAFSYGGQKADVNDTFFPSLCKNLSGKIIIRS